MQILEFELLKNENLPAKIGVDTGDKSLLKFLEHRWSECDCHGASDRSGSESRFDCLGGIDVVSDQGMDDLTCPRETHGGLVPFLQACS